MPRQARERGYHHGDLKNALIDQSIALLEAEGPEALTVAEVGRRVGVSSGAPYKHFPDRQALLRAVAWEANRRLNEAVVAEVGPTADPTEAFRLACVAYVRWAAEHPALHRLVTDPALMDYTSRPTEVPTPEAIGESLETFWPELAALARSGGALAAAHPLIVQLRGRALAQGLASFYVSGIFEALEIGAAEAERLARAVTGEDVPARGRPRGTKVGRRR